MPAYELRSGGDVKNKKQSVADLKYRRLTELNARLKEDLDRPRVKVSEAALSCVQSDHPPPPPRSPLMMGPPTLHTRELGLLTVSFVSFD